MDTVSVIGMGAMGSALAQTFLNNNYSVTVWNRTTSKCDALVDKGANLASTAVSAVGASDMMVICVTDYPASSEILETEEVEHALRGKLVVQLSTGTPQEARESQAWIHNSGADYLDGAIMAFPRNIGTPDAFILLAGHKATFERYETILNSLGTIRFLGKTSVSLRRLIVPFFPSLISPLWGTCTGRSSANLRHCRLTITPGR